MCSTKAIDLYLPTMITDIRDYKKNEMYLGIYLFSRHCFSVFSQFTGFPAYTKEISFRFF